MGDSITQGQHCSRGPLLQNHDDEAQQPDQQPGNPAYNVLDGKGRERCVAYQAGNCLVLQHEEEAVAGSGELNEPRVKMTHNNVYVYLTYIF